jgi:hypothetical protein
LEQARTKDLERYLITAQQTSKRAAALTHRLLAFSRRHTLVPTTTNINHLVTGMEDLVRRTMGPSITVEVVTAGGLWNTLVDPHQLENALVNLVCRPMHSLLMARINGSPLPVDAESLSPSQCVRLQFQKARRIPSVRRGSIVLASAGSSAIALFCTKTVRKREGSGLVRWLRGHAQLHPSHV